MAEVFRASRRAEGGFVRTVCIKRLLRHVELDESMAASFGDEARIMAALHHPAIVTVLDYGRHQGRTFLAMELVDGADLRKVLRRTGPLPSELAVYVGHEIATALAHAHAARIDGVAQRVVHRDVTPSNVLVSVDGTVKLTDFGIAKATTRAQVTQHGMVKGKVPYMSPEQAVGMELDQRADLFALGVVLFECIAGRRPYDGPSDLDTFRNIQSGVHEPLDRLAPSTPRPLVDLVHALLRPRREDRATSASDVVEILGRMPVSLHTRRALRDRVARAQATAPRRSIAAPMPSMPPAAPAPLLAPAQTRAVKARKPELRSITEAMSPAALAELLLEDARKEPPWPRKTALGDEEVTDRNPPAAARQTGSIRISRRATVVIAVAWIALSSLLGGLAAHLLPSAAIGADVRTAIGTP